MRKVGQVKMNRVTLQPHEMATVLFLADQGWDVTLIPKSNKAGVHTPDIKMFGLAWEIKSPKGEGKWVLKNTVQRASHQSENIILDLVRIKVHQTRCMSELQKYFKNSKRLKRMMIITKNRRVIDLRK